MKKRILWMSVAALAAVIAPGFLAVARAAQFSAGNAIVSGLGDEINSGYDIFSITGLNGDWNTGNPQNIAGLTFTAGVNCNACTSTPTGLLGFSLQVGSITNVAYVGWTWSSIGSADMLDISAPADMTFVQPTGEVDVVSFQATSLLASTGGPVSENLIASAGIPEPASMLVIAAGLCGMGVVKRRKLA